ncbi:hypothetical protein [Xylophilus sp. GOD-11R]|uniref:hypothetical protein n=1 Tax=Xylophilus sp. GOD-11R TaxID=3089814 RepID=UPI00298CB596|nr:hypothetical protein [Xylophilus sp. GOD-11R]WPB57841.1 hypothetical protein R9X41_04115 [Xylophilus sp. GOD-11R]
MPRSPISLSPNRSAWLAVIGIALITIGVGLRRRQRRLRNLQERRSAWQELQSRVDSRLEHARFSYRPAAHALVLDARAAQWHGVAAESLRAGDDVLVAGWHDLPATQAAAGWIDSALREALAKKEPVQCEYLARSAGSLSLHLILTAVPLPSSGLLLGTVALYRVKALSGETGGMVARPSFGVQEEELAAAMSRAWMPGEQAAASA